MWLIALAAALSAASAGDGLTGLWENSNNTVVANVTICGPALCGRIVRASGSAEDDARAAGAPGMVGTQVLRNFQASGENRWRGRVFVPARNRSFSAVITRIDPRRIRIGACILGGLLCQSEDWHRAR